MQNREEKNNKPLLYTLIAILLLIVVVMFFMLRNTKGELSTTVAAKTEVENKLKGKEEALTQANLLIEQYHRDSVALAGQNKSMSQDLIRRKQEIAKLVAEIKSNKASSQSTISDLNNKLTELNAKLVELELKNQELTRENSTLKSNNSELNKEVQTLSTEKSKLKSLASRLQASALKVETLKKKWLSGKETGTLRAKDVEAFRISFNITENNVADAGQKTIYVKITGPEGTTYLGPAGESTFDFEGKSSKYTYKVITTFENETKAVEPSIWKPNNSLKTGKYTIEIYSEGYKMGSSVLDLK
ncbi:MAG: hypothetical protein ACK448_10180 [Bacteroidota bacterium]|jgi:hypothetical protein